MDFRIAFQGCSNLLVPDPKSDLAYSVTFPSVFEADDAEIQAGMNQTDRERIARALRAANLPVTPANMAETYRRTIAVRGRTMVE